MSYKLRGITGVSKSYFDVEKELLLSHPKYWKHKNHVTAVNTDTLDTYELFCPQCFNPKFLASWGLNNQKFVSCVNKHKNSVYKLLVGDIVE